MNNSLIQATDYAQHLERMNVSIFASVEVASKLVAKEIAKTIIEKTDKNENCVLGLPAGSTPVQIYNALVELYKHQKLSFRNVVVFNTDEFYPIDNSALQSRYRYMYEYLFDHVNIRRENIHLFDGGISKEKIADFCNNFEKKIENAGGIDIQLLGVDGAGQIGANEPGSAINSRTRVLSLNTSTRIGKASDFYCEENVPLYCFTMGLGTILNAKKILLMAWGESKAKIIQRLVEEKQSELVPASCLQSHPNVNVIIDEAAAAHLTRIRTPWLVGNCKWSDKMVKRAVFWLCEKLNKPILKLTSQDYSNNGMNDLITERGTAYDINIKVFNELQHTITGWPGGKPNADDSTRPERAKPYPKRVIIFSPHPDDDVISMGGTLARLSEQGHDVHVAYQTSGSIAVADDEAVRFLDFVRDYAQIYEQDKTIAEKSYIDAVNILKAKKPGESDCNAVREIKAAIRRSEAKAACRFLNIPESRTHFLNMPFYETGTVKKKPINEEDIKIIIDLLQKIKPHQIFAAGDLSDPHGTHRVCFQAIEEALKRLKKEQWINDCRVWLYRGAWQEWDIAESEMAVPLSPNEVIIKRLAIYKHQSQKDRPLFPGTDSREFWMRAEQRNENTAKIFDKLGMAEYQAIELFVQYKMEE
ncbi:MAG: glucosamine-6-phosphate deaminase [Prevotellaceae bacterium]|jgi:glucosamine-6-phosphate deaminase|nr:glucosamine-6-phosphate deaminase [Prevotellaceae bacterium]